MAEPLYLRSTIASLSSTTIFYASAADGSTDGKTSLSSLSASIAPPWGNITGTLANQTDLQSALDGKLSTSGTAADVDPSGTQIAAELHPSSYFKVTDGGSLVANVSAGYLLGAEIAPQTVGVSDEFTSYINLSPAGETTANASFTSALKAASLDMASREFNCPRTPFEIAEILLPG